MKILGKKHFIKLKKKNKGNLKLNKAIDKLISDLENAKWKNKDEVLKARGDADCVHKEGFYFFDLNIHRSLILIEYQPVEADEDEGVANIIWVGSHEDYMRVFKNNKDTIEKWLRAQGLIE